MGEGGRNGGCAFTGIPVTQISWGGQNGGTSLIFVLFMKIIKNTVRFLLLLVILNSCVSCTRVPPGYAGIRVNQVGSDKGVESYPLVTGYVFYNPITTAIIEYPCFVQTAVWTKSVFEGSPNNEEITFNTKEGLVVSGDISLSYQLNRDDVPAFYVKFRTDNINNFTHGFLRNIARDAFNEIAATYGVEEIYGAKKEDILKAVRDRINGEVKVYGVEVQQFGFIGALRIPDNVTEALNNKIKATQDAIRVENELRQSKAQAQKVVAAAEGEAEANRILAASITPQLIQWKQLQLTQDAIARWDGKRPQVEGGNSGLLLQLTPQH